MTISASPNQLQGVAVVTGAGSGVSVALRASPISPTFSDHIAFFN